VALIQGEVVHNRRTANDREAASYFASVDRHCRRPGRHGVADDRRPRCTQQAMRHAVGHLRSKLRPGSVVILFFGGYGIQAGGNSYMIPVDAAIWQEADVRRDGISIEAVLNEVKQQGAHATLVVIDASRRIPYERRFRGFSRGLAPIDVPDNALILTSAAPGKAADDLSDQPIWGEGSACRGAVGTSTRKSSVGLS